MPDKQDAFGFDDRERSTTPSGDNTVINRVEELAWALVDDQLDADDLHLLESLLMSDDEARSKYVDCMQLHADLLVHFRPRAEGDGAVPTVFGLPTDITTPIISQPPATDESQS